MKKKDVCVEIEEMAARDGKVLPWRTIETVLDYLAEMVKTSLSGNKRAVLVGIGYIEPRLRNPRKGRNLKTGETVQVPARYAVRFRASAGVRDALPGLGNGQA